MVELTTRPAMDDVATRRNVYDVLAERGYIAEVSDEAGLRAALADPGNRPVTLYVGFDATGTSLHIGHLLSIMVLKHMQLHGHRPIALCGGGTTMIGDPTDKTSTRPLLTVEQIAHNLAAIRAQFARYLDFDSDQPNRARLVNNADWLLDLKYIEFLRDIGKHFTVNQMLSHSTYRDRLATGSLNFIEINYVLLQSYDFLHLFRDFGCTLQFGGGDQWFNVLAGADLIRRVDGGQAFAAVTPLLETTDGRKMGKTEAGATWLDPAQTSPYEFYQFWINVDDADVGRLLKLYTFLPLDEIAALGRLEGAELRRAKEVLALEATAISHGEDAARQAQAEARALFAGGGVTLSGAGTLPGLAGSGVGLAVSAPTTTLPRADLAAGVPLLDVLVASGLVKSKGEGRRLVAQGGAYVNSTVIEGAEARLTLADSQDGVILLRAGKKRYARIVVEGTES